MAGAKATEELAEAIPMAMQLWSVRKDPQTLARVHWAQRGQVRYSTCWCEDCLNSKGKPYNPTLDTLDQDEFLRSFRYRKAF